jgi:hypothetical protein
VSGQVQRAEPAVTDRRHGAPPAGGLQEQRHLDVDALPSEALHRARVVCILGKEPPPLAGGTIIRVPALHHVFPAALLHAQVACGRFQQGNGPVLSSGGGRRPLYKPLPATASPP